MTGKTSIGVTGFEKGVVSKNILKRCIFGSSKAVQKEIKLPLTYSEFTNQL